MLYKQVGVLKLIITLKVDNISDENATRLNK